jgi:hypothetical protein
MLMIAELTCQERLMQRGEVKGFLLFIQLKPLWVGEGGKVGTKWAHLFLPSVSHEADS